MSMAQLGAVISLSLYNQHLFYSEDSNGNPSENNL